MAKSWPIAALNVMTNCIPLGRQRGARPTSRCAPLARYGMKVDVARPQGRFVFMAVLGLKEMWPTLVDDLGWGEGPSANNRPVLAA